ncbi:MAG: sigma 54-interacting transcriptional regulator [Clostridia bacterium]|nr:sigma 54-interacting transcriptional regulator [Clostridia bacterium]
MNNNFKGLSDSELRNVIDNLHDEIMIYDNNYRLVYVNNACIRHYGFDTDKFLGKKFNQLDEIYWGNSTLPDVYKEKKIVAKHQITNLGNDIITISVPIFDEKGKIKYVGQNVNDIYVKSEIGKAEEFFLDVSKKEKENDVPYIYKSNQIKKLLDIVEKTKNITSPCLILGETGTGKSYLAKYIHSRSNRKNNPFVAVNCACINPNLLESELFGYKRGAFSGASNSGKKGIVEIADGGTLFLDEISEIPYDLQGKMLEFIQEQEFMSLGSEAKKKVDVKIITATNRNLRQMVESGSFRQDLYFRLDIFELTIPPLRERRSDIEILLNYYLDKYNKMYFRNLTLSDDAKDILMHYSWPGNVRELEHIVEKTVVLANGKEILVKDMPKSIFDIYSKPQNFCKGKTLNEVLESVERQVVSKAYKKCKNSVAVAKELGISQPKAYRLIKKYGLK